MSHKNTINWESVIHDNRSHACMQIFSSDDHTEHINNDGILRARRISDDKVRSRDDIMTALEVYSESVEMLDFNSKIPEASLTYSGNEVVAVSYTLPAPKLINSYKETRLVDIANATFKHDFTLEKIDSTHYNLVM